MKCPKESDVNCDSFFLLPDCWIDQGSRKRDGKARPYPPFGGGYGLGLEGNVSGRKTEGRRGYETTQSSKTNMSHPSRRRRITTYGLIRTHSRRYHEGHGNLSGDDGSGGKFRR